MESANFGSVTTTQLKQPHSILELYPCRYFTSKHQRFDNALRTLVWYRFASKIFVRSWNTGDCATSTLNLAASTRTTGQDGEFFDFKVISIHHFQVNNVLCWSILLINLNIFIVIFLCVALNKLAIKVRFTYLHKTFIQIPFGIPSRDRFFLRFHSKSTQNISTVFTTK